MEAIPGAERQQHFFTKRVFELFELQRRFALIAEHFEHRRAALFGHFDARILQVHDVHLQGLHQKIRAISTTGTRHGQIGNSSRRRELYEMGSG